MVPCHDSLFFVCVCVCVIPSYISVSHAKKKKKKRNFDNRLFLDCMFCFPKSGNSPFDFSLIMHTYACGCTCTDDI